MRAPTRKQLARMRWARKAVSMDGTTRGGFRWPVGVGGWVTEDVPGAERNGEACGVGLHLGLTVAGLSSAHRLTESILLCVGYLPEDVVGEDLDKVRVERCWAMPGVTAGLPQVLRDGWGTGANLTWANLTRADLTGADLTGADLTGANLTRVYLTWANLTGAYLTGANLTWANLPSGWTDQRVRNVGGIR